MVKVYIVTRTYRSICKGLIPEEPEVVITGVFDSKEKAIKHIYGQVEADHKFVDIYDPNEERLMKWMPFVFEEGVDVISYCSYGPFRMTYGLTGVSYQYISKDVE